MQLAPGHGRRGTVFAPSLTRELGTRRARECDVVAEDSDYYSVLGLNPDASEHEIEQTFRTFLGEYFRDGSPSSDRQQDLERMTEAYSVLIDPEKRARYDEQLGLARPRRRHGFHLGLDVGIARVSVGIGQVDDLMTMGGARGRTDPRS